MRQQRDSQAGTRRLKSDPGYVSSLLHFLVKVSAAAHSFDATAGLGCCEESEQGQSSPPLRASFDFMVLELSDLRQFCSLKAGPGFMACSGK